VNGITGDATFTYKDLWMTNSNFKDGNSTADGGHFKRTGWKTAIRLVDHGKIFNRVVKRNLKAPAWVNRKLRL